jgi:transcriptional regulator with XRE-family HTH domain
MRNASSRAFQGPLTPTIFGFIESMNEATLFGQLLRATRKAHNMGQAELAEKVGIGAKHLGRVERGEKVPSFELIIALANAMGESPSVFFEFENARVDQKVVKERLRQLLDKRDLDQLRKAYRVLRATLTP